MYARSVTRPKGSHVSALLAIHDVNAAHLRTAMHFAQPCVKSTRAFGNWRSSLHFDVIEL